MHLLGLFVPIGPLFWRIDQRTESRPIVQRNANFDRVSLCCESRRFDIDNKGWGWFGQGVRQSVGSTRDPLRAFPERK